MLINKKLNASLSIEAALSMSIFTIAICTLLGPFIILKNNSKVLKDLNDSFSKRVSYVKGIEKDYLQNKKDGIEKDVSQYVDMGINSINSLYSVYKIFDDTVEYCYSHKNTVYDEESKLIEYDIEIIHKVPFSSIIPVTVKQRLVSSRRAFVGVEGERWEGLEEILGNSDIVFISKNSLESKVYHESEYCSYLRHKLICFTEREAKKKYHLCSYCKVKYKEEKNAEEVYCTQYGDNYHYIETCPYLHAYIKKVIRSSVPYMRCCEKCKKENKN